MTIDPFMINLTESVVVCLASNAILMWRYQSPSNQRIGAELVTRKRERTFHIDESPSLIGDSTDEAVLKEVFELLSHI